MTKCLGAAGQLINYQKKNKIYFTFLLTVFLQEENKFEEIKQRKKNSLKALKILGVNQSKFLSYPDNSLDKCRSKY